ncbi:hypothetical protein FRB97_000733 [Tulasnella sp. 331]|nr:hypothetical protein FRB97_000733 [Tulasnella sp. 331]
MCSRNATPAPSQYKSTTLSSALDAVFITPEMSTISLDLTRNLLEQLEMQAPSKRLLVGIPEASSGLAEAIGCWLEQLIPGISIVIPFDRDFSDQDAYVRSLKLLREPVGVVCDLNGSIAPTGPSTVEIPITTTGCTARAKVVLVSRSHRLVLIQMPHPGNTRRSMNDPDIIAWDVILDDLNLTGKKDSGVGDGSATAAE